MTKVLLIFLLCLTLGIPAVTAQDTTGPPNSLSTLEVEDIVGEYLSYDIGFLWFDKLAMGYSTFSMGEEKGVFEAFLEARTRGMAALFTQHRRQNYLARMEMGPDGIMRTLVYERHIIKGKGDRKRDRSKRYVFDYENRQIAFSRGEDGRYGDVEYLSMPEEGGYYDILTAFYNFRLGLYGDIERGKRFVIPSLTRKGPSQIIVEVLSRQQQQDNDIFPDKGLLCRVQVDEEVFDSQGGGIFVWFDEKGRPAAGIVEKVLGMGNVHGSLR